MKSFEEFLKPDSRIVTNPNEIEKSIKNLHEHALESTLVEQVPENVRSLWEVAQHLFVYSCYSYDFLPVAKTYCLFSLEQALKEIIRKKLGQSVAEKVETFGGANQYLDKLFPGITELQKRWFEHKKNSRNMVSHPPGKTLFPYWNVPMEELSLFINGLFYDLEPQLLLPSRYLFDKNELLVPFKKAWLKLSYCPTKLSDHIHITKCQEFVKHCDANDLAVVGIYGALKVETGTEIAEGISADFSNLYDEKWEKYKRVHNDSAIKVIKSWPIEKHLYLVFDFVHKGEWLSVELLKRISPNHRSLSNEFF